MNLLRTWITAIALASAVAPAALAAEHPSFQVEVTGSGPAMILIPGLSSAGDVWRSTVEHYKSRFECHVLTLAGFAGTAPIDEPVVAAVRRELPEYIKALRLQKPTVVGHSLGGTLALAVAADHPDLVGTLIIVDSLPFMGGVVFQTDSADNARAQSEMVRRAITSQTPQQYRAFVETGQTTKYLVMGEANHALVQQWSLTSTPGTVGNALGDIYSLDLRSQLSSITAPTLVLGSWKGQREQLQQYGVVLPRENFVATFHTQFAELKNMRFAMAENAWHFIMLDDPEWMFGEMDAFLTR